jgi:dihydropteroate synthase
MSKTQNLSAAKYGVDLSSPVIMGILNVTPDSFSDGGKFLDKKAAVAHALRMERDGATIIDVGGESSRPGSDSVSEQEELDRTLPVIRGIRAESEVLISIDTCKSVVAHEALQTGANWVNDISGLQSDDKMTEVIKESDCPVVVMHMKGKPKTMQDNPVYKDVCAEVNQFFTQRIRMLNNAGIEKIILDPGIGFGKRFEDNLDLINGLQMFGQHDVPLLIGPSRKSFLGTITGQVAEKRLAGTLASMVIAVQNGADIVRVHDVAPARDALAVVAALMARS